MNIGRHAHASQFSITVKKKKDHVSFVIQDNGSGFDKADIVGPKGLKQGLGIFSMEERVRILGGSIDIQAKPGEGTKISFNLPIKAN
jgi:signal transduction histidine kinase